MKQTCITMKQVWRHGLLVLNGREILGDAILKHPLHGCLENSKCQQFQELLILLQKLLRRYFSFRLKIYCAAGQRPLKC